MSPMELENQVIEGFRLSPQQKRLWLLQQDNPVYRVQGAILLEGNLKSEALQAALQQVINRHEILRTAFLRPQSITTPIQVIKASSPLLCNQIDLSAWEAQQQLSQIDYLLQQEKFMPFDLETGVNLRCSLLKLSTQKYILIVTMPSICADSWTLNNLVQEISYFYDYSVNEEIDEEVVQYIQFSEWQNQLLEDEQAVSGQEYWQNLNLSLVDTLKLPFELKSSQAANKFNFHTVEFQIPPHLVDKIEVIAQQYDTDISVFFLACWQVILWRFINQADIVIGVGCDGRKYEELQTSYGLFAKYLPLHCQLQKNYHFSEFLQILGSNLKNIYKWEEYFTWEKYAELSSSEVDSCWLPFNFEFQQQSATYSAGEVSFSIYKDYTCIEPFKLKFECVRTESVVAKLHYDSNRFCAEDIQRLARHLQTLIESAIACPSATINQLEILSVSDRQQLLVFNNTQVDIPQNKCIHQLFEEQVQSTPDDIAVVYEEQQLTYIQLNQRANQLAHYLQTLGVKPEVLVGIAVERSLDMIVGILGILKAGGAYLPIDPALPKEAINFRLQNAQVSLLITQTHLGDMQDLNFKCVYLDVVPNESATNLDSGVTNANLVYTIYTSGSTGNPKGVSIEHSSLVNYVNAILARIELPSAAHFATVSTLAADLGNTVIFPSLCTGGCLHIISSERATNPEALAAYCRNHPIDCLKIVPSHLEALLTASDPKAILPRQRLILGGEAVSWELIEKIHKIAPNCVIFNHYGPTEATIGVTTFKIPNPTTSQERPQGTVPLGYPLANTQIYLLDEDLQPVPMYVPGEVYIGGHGVARNYLHQPKLTAQKFIPNPFSSQAGARLYQTGDLARCLSDGSIQFLGRIDNQVKIRGFRIEPGEIEAVLCQHPKVQQAVVIAREDEPGNKCLVAYIVAKEAIASHSQFITQLRDFLRNKLPEYMIPAALVLLKALPLTPNGKVNRYELPAPIDNNSELETAFLAPRNHLELQIAQIWEDILNIKPIGVTNNFFDLGGHSLLSVRLIARLQQQFQQDIPLSSLFQAGTIEHLAGIISQSTKSVYPSGVIEIQPKGTKPPFFCVRPYGGNVLCYYNFARYLGCDQPFYGLQETSTLFEKPFQPYSQIADMATHHISSMRAVQPKGPYFLGGWSMGGVVAFEIANQLQSQGEQVALLALFDSKAPIADNISTNYQDVDDTTLLTELATATAQSFGKELLLSQSEIKQIEPEKQLSYILHQMKAANLTTPDVKLEQIGYYLQVCRSDNQAIRNYQPQIYPQRITLFCTENNQNVAATNDSAQGWQKLSTQTVEVIFVPGDHQTMIALPHVQILAEQVKIYLDKIYESIPLK